MLLLGAPVTSGIRLMFGSVRIFDCRSSTFTADKLL